jgi:hypothetical protein
MHHARFSLAFVLAVAACQTAPTNGTTAGGSVIGKTFTFSGFFNQPNVAIVLDVMKDPTQDPANNANWTPFTFTATSTTETIVNRPDPLFAWTVTAAPVPSTTVAARWPQGGLVRVRARHPDATNGDTVLVSFDDVTFSTCLGQQLNAGADWVTIGSVCQGLGRNNGALVSTTNVPVAAGTAATNGGFLGRKGTIKGGDTALYYTAIGAPTTLASFKTTFGFQTGDVRATFFNDTDLGLGRDAHCRLLGGGGMACFATMFSGVAGRAAFNQDPNVVLADAVANRNSFVTLAMVSDGTSGDNAVKFMAYDVAGNLTTTVQLDSTANNVSVPTNCIACHGINATFNNTTHVVSGNAKFLPFDVFNFTYSTTAGFTFNDQADRLRQLNALVKATNPSLGIAQLIDGMYAPNGAGDPTSVANNTFIPAAWQAFNSNLDGTSLYNGLIKVGCRTCHVSDVNTLFDFNEPNDFTTLAPFIRAEVCGATHIMPHSERAMRKFWESGGRAYLVTGLPPASFPDALNACKP